MELRAYDVVVSLSVGKSQNYQKLRINYVTATSCVSWVLLSWKLAFSHNFSPHNTCIWNNRFILHHNKSLFYENWVQYNIYSLLDMMDNYGNVLNYNDFCLKHGFCMSPQRILHSC